MNATLPPYLRSLWNIAPALLDIAEPQATRPFLSPLGLHLPLNAPAGSPKGSWFHAAAAHAAAHLVFSNHRFDPAGLRPVTQVLLAALEDARVEWLACRELPGLRRLWLPFHTFAPADTASDTPSFEDLLRRLARCLLDPSHPDPHPWVAKGRQLFFVDAAGEMLALRQPDALRHAASLLGHDIGQMRLQFNARLYLVAPSYRDDNSCLWQADERRADTEHEILATPEGGHGSMAAPTPVADVAQRHTYPEWDRAVPMYRTDWCAVHDLHAAASATPTGGEMPRPAPPPSCRVHQRQQLDGDDFDLDALVSAAIARRAGEAVQARVYQRQHRRPAAEATLLLIDTSASTAALLPAAREAALRHAAAAVQAGGRCAIHAFCSDGRHAVHYQRVKDFGEVLGPACLSRLMALRARLSTRLGAALRHATQLVGTQRGMLRRVLLLTDGRPHDIDVHDPHYLLADARQAVREAARRKVLIECLCLDAQALPALRSVFGAGLRHA